MTDTYNMMGSSPERCCARKENSTAGAVMKYCSASARAFLDISHFASDVRAIAQDPAIRDKATGILEIPLYASFWALLFYRFAHFLHASRIPVLPRLISQTARLLTGIEIHPGARIGPGLFIDHGMGTVIGETAVVGSNVLLFHGVTLGSVDGRTGRRHPEIGDEVIVGAGAKILGAVTVGKGARIGAQSVVLMDVPALATAVGVPARIREKPLE